MQATSPSPASDDAAAGDGRDDPPEVLQKDLRAGEERAMMQARNLTFRLGEELREQPTREEKLSFLRHAFEVYSLRPTETLWFHSAGMIVLMEFLAETADRLTGFLPPTDVHLRGGAPTADLLRPIFTIADRCEEKLLWTSGIPLMAGLHMATLHSAHARKASYHAALSGMAARDGMGTAYLALAVLQACSGVKRYEALLPALLDAQQTDPKIPIPEAEHDGLLIFLEHVRERHNLPADPQEWAMETVQRLFAGGFRCMDEVRSSPYAMKEILSKVRGMLDDFTRGLYAFSPGLLRWSAEAMLDRGFEDFARLYATRATICTAAAARLGIHP